MPSIPLARQVATETEELKVTSTVSDSLSTKLIIDQDRVSSEEVTYNATLDGTMVLSGVGGGPTRTVTPTTTTQAPLQTAETSDPSATTATGSKDIPLGAVIAAFVVIAVLCCALMGFFWWKRRREREARRLDREFRMNRQRNEQIGGHTHSTDKDAPWEEFKDPPPGALSSPGSFYSVDAHQPQPSSTPAARPRRHSVKSTVTGKINPSNNFAASAYHYEEDDDDDDYDSRSMRSRPPISPPSGKVQFRDMRVEHGNAAGSVVNSRDEDPSDFLTFRSDQDPDNSFPPIPQYIHQDGPLREGPAPRTTPVPKRANTQRSHKVANDGEKKAKQSNMIALTNLIAALDSQEPQRPSTETHQSAGDGAQPSSNPFQDPSFVKNLREALPSSSTR